MHIYRIKLVTRGNPAASCDEKVSNRSDPHALLRTNEIFNERREKRKSRTRKCRGQCK